MYSSINRAGFVQKKLTGKREKVVDWESNALSGVSVLLDQLCVSGEFTQLF